MKRLRRAVFAACLTSSLLGLALGCDDSSSGTGGKAPFCADGFVRTVDGKPTCEGLCDPSKCTNAGNVCVDNFCALPCEAAIDCAYGQECSAATEDGSGAMISVCRPGKAKIGLPCPLGTECDAELACPDGSSCDTAQCGGGECAPDPAACAGVDHCALGRCAGDGAACVVLGCDPSTCRPLTCRSNGVGDGTAFCTMLDCQDDGDCGEGLLCAQRADPHAICGQPAPVGACGHTMDPCVDPSMNASNGTTFSQGSVCTERNECRVRSQCDPCTTDRDCGRLAGARCAPGGFCAFECLTDTECANGFQCTGGLCAPRSGSCSGTGEFCATCTADADCQAGSLCELVGVGGLRACLPIAKTCATSSACPVAPSGAHGFCDAGACIFPVEPETYLQHCWCSNTGDGCFADDTCCSKKCVGASGMTPGSCG